MRQPPSEPGSRPSPQPTLLEDFLKLSVESRAAHVLQAGAADLTTTLQRLRQEGVVIPGGMENRLAWAIAFNMEGVPGAGGAATAASRRGIQAYKDRWPLSARFADIWSVLTKSWTSPNPGHTATLLDELALSVLCEHKSDWQDPLSRPVDVETANQAFDFVYVQNKAKVIGDVRRTFGERADSPEAIADEAWARVFSSYWSPESRRRFLGLCRISTLVCQVARYVAIDRIHDKGAFVTDGGSAVDADDQSSGFLLERIGVIDDPSENIAGEQLEQIIREGMGLLPPKQRIVVEMVWLKDFSAKEAAERLHISEPAISQHLKKARETLRPLLKKHGFDIPS